jgi:hypothetical protein
MTNKIGFSSSKFKCVSKFGLPAHCGGWEGAVGQGGRLDVVPTGAVPLGLVVVVPVVVLGDVVVEPVVPAPGVVEELPGWAVLFIVEVLELVVVVPEVDGAVVVVLVPEVAVGAHGTPPLVVDGVVLCGVGVTVCAEGVAVCGVGEVVEGGVAVCGAGGVAACGIGVAVCAGGVAVCGDGAAVPVGEPAVDCVLLAPAKPTARHSRNTELKNSAILNFIEASKICLWFQPLDARGSVRALQSLTIPSAAWIEWRQSNRTCNPCAFNRFAFVGAFGDRPL